MFSEVKRLRLFFLVLLSTGSLNATAQNIYRTACAGNLERLDSLLANAAINTPDDRGRSLLHWAVACKKPDVVDFLVDKGITLNQEDGDGITPLQMTIQFNSPPLFEKLMALQTSEDWKDQYGASLLQTAILRKNLDFVKRLLKAGISPEVRNERGSTPLEIALRTGEDEIAEWLIAKGADKQLVRKIKLQGAYLGQKPAGKSPKLFAPNFISTEESEFGSVFNATGNEFYYGVDVNGKPEIRYTRLVDNEWSQPLTILPEEPYGYNDPFLSPDEKRLYFISRRPLKGQGELKDHDIWYVERNQEGWSNPINAGPNINSEGNEYYISFTKTGTMYFASNVNAPEERRRSDQDIYYSRFINGAFQEPVRLGTSVNTPGYEADAFVSPDEDYLIFCSTRPEGLGRGDMYISFKNIDGSWTQAVNMGDKINTKHHELCPFVTADGKYLFFTSNQDIYWVDAKVIEEFRK
ncbi:MAG: hypothetical protein Roseis2KO_09110 [Roseivirga sp.]